MASSNLLFSFEDLTSKNKVVQKVIKAFNKDNAFPTNEKDIEIGNIKKKSGIKYRDIFIPFKDSQTVTLSIKETGDIFQVKVNNKVTPIKNQDDQNKALKEIAGIMEKGRKAFQAKLARQTKVSVPKGLKSSATKVVNELTTQGTSLDEQIAELQKQVSEAKATRDQLQNELTTTNEQIKSVQAGA